MSHEDGAFVKVYHDDDEVVLETHRGAIGMTPHRARRLSKALGEHAYMVEAQEANEWDDVIARVTEERA